MNRKNKNKKQKDIQEKNPLSVLFSEVKNIFDYKTRATRKEYWMSYLGLIIVRFFLIILMEIPFLIYCDFKFDLVNLVNDIKEFYQMVSTIYFNELLTLEIVLILFNLLMLFTFVSLTIRRFHDAGISSKTYLMSLLSMVVFIGLIPYIIINYPECDFEKVLLICLGLPLILKVYVFIVTLMSSDEDNKWGLNKLKILKERKHRQKKIKKVLDDEVKKNDAKKIINENKSEEEKITVRKVRTFKRDEKESSLSKMDLLRKLNNGEITPEEYDKLNKKLLSKNNESKESKDNKEIK